MFDKERISRLSSYEGHREVAQRSHREYTSSVSFQTPQNSGWVVQCRHNFGIAYFVTCDWQLHNWCISGHFLKFETEEVME